MLLLLTHDWIGSSAVAPTAGTELTTTPAPDPGNDPGTSFIREVVQAEEVTDAAVSAIDGAAAEEPNKEEFEALWSSVDESSPAARREGCSGGGGGSPIATPGGGGSGKEDRLACGGINGSPPPGIEGGGGGGAEENPPDREASENGVDDILTALPHPIIIL